MPNFPKPMCLLLLVAGCSCGDTETVDGGVSDVGPVDARDGRDADGGDARDGAIPGADECAWEPGERPSAELPPEHTNEYVIELERWMISNDSGDPVETRTRMNEAIVWATENGFDKVVVPPGSYHLGEPTNDIYAGGIELVGDMTFELSDGAVIQMATNDRHNYCVISVQSHDDITIRGGEIRGDRETHIFEGGTSHDEGHGICVWTAASHVLIEDMELHELTGDGVLIVGRRESDEMAEDPSTHITIRDNEIHHNRRQGVSVVGAHNVVIANNHIHHIEGTSPQFGIDIEGAGRTDRDILVFQNNFHDNAGGDVVTSSGHNVWIEENTMTQCQVGEEGVYDASLPCDLERQWDAPIILWKETDNVVLNNTIRMSMGTVNGRFGIVGYADRDSRAPTRENPVGNTIVGNTFYDAGIHMAWNRRYFVADNTLYEGVILAYLLGCTRLENNRINRTASENYKLRNVAGTARGNVLNRTEGFPPEDDVPMHFPMADDAPYRNSSPVFW